MRSSMIRCGAGIVTANNVLVDTSSFVNILSPADDDVQKVCQSIDGLEFSATTSKSLQLDSANDGPIINVDSGGGLTLTESDGVTIIGVTVDAMYLESGGGSGITLEAGELWSVGDNEGIALESDTKDWKLVSGWAYNGLTEPPTIDVSEEVRAYVNVGIPIRFLDPTGIVVTNIGTGEISGFTTLTGLIGAILEPSGRLYIELVDEGVGNYRVDFYAHADLSSGVLRGLVGHSASYSAIGSVNVFEDNGSGLGGSITVDVLGSGVYLVEFYRWGIVTFVNELYIGFAGQAITSNVSHMWYGRPTKVISLKDFVNGTAGTSAHLLQSNNSQYSYYSKAPGRVVRQNFIPFTVSNAGVTITYQVDQPGGYSGGLSDIFTSRLSLSTVSLVHSSQEVAITTGLNRLVYGDRLEIASDSTPSGELMGTVENVSCKLVIVLE